MNKAQSQHHVQIGSLTLGNDLPLVLIAGPCQMESRAHALEVASALKEMTHTLVTDMRSLPIMAKLGYPVVMDATHAVQQPGGQGTSSGGQREFAPVIARAAVSLGIAAVFMETHPDPDHAPSDGPNMIRLKDMPSILSELVEIDAIAKKRARI